MRSYSLAFEAIMAPHLSASELNFVFAEKGKGLSPTAVHSKLSHRRSKRGVPAPTLGNLRKTLKGTTYKRGKVESRGQKKTLTFKKLRAINATRRKMIKKAGGEEEVSSLPSSLPSPIARLLVHSRFSMAQT